MIYENVAGIGEWKIDQIDGWWFYWETRRTFDYYVVSYTIDEATWFLFWPLSQGIMKKIYF